MTLVGRIGQRTKSHLQVTAESNRVRQICRQRS